MNRIEWGVDVTDCRIGVYYLGAVGVIGLQVGPLWIEVFL